MNKCRWCGVSVAGVYPLCDSYECGNKDNAADMAAEDVADIRRARVVTAAGEDVTTPREQIGFVV